MLISQPLSYINCWSSSLNLLAIILIMACIFISSMSILNMHSTGEGSLLFISRFRGQSLGIVQSPRMESRGGESICNLKLFNVTRNNNKLVSGLSFLFLGRLDTIPVNNFPLGVWTAFNNSTGDFFAGGSVFALQLARSLAVS